MESDDLVINLGLRFDFDSQFWVLNDPEDPNYLSPLKPLARWNDLNQDGSISDDEMNYNNLKTDSARISSNSGDPWYRKADPKTQLSPRFALAFPITDKVIFIFLMATFFKIQNLVIFMIILNLKFLSFRGEFHNGECKYGTTKNDPI